MGFKLSTPSQCIIGGGIGYEVLLPGAVMWNVAPFKQKHTNKNNARWWFQSSWNTLVKTGGGFPSEETFIKIDLLVEFEPSI